MSARDDLAFMELAIAQAQLGGAAGEVPVGAVALFEERVIGAGFNCPISAHDPTAHAEIVAMRAAAAALAQYRLTDVSLYVTLEPCVMCVGAMIHARMARVVYGARDQKAGALGSVYDLGRDGRLNHRLEVGAAVAEDRCAALLRDFFASRRGD